MNLTLSIVLTSLALHVVMFVIVWRAMRRRADMTTRTPAAPHWHRRFSAQRTLKERGDTLAESLLMILFCGVVAAALTICISDDEDMPGAHTPATTTANHSTPTPLP